MAVEAKEAMAYVGSEPECGCVTFLIVDNPEHAKDTAREVARMMRAGLTINRMTVEDARVPGFGSCPHWKLTGRNGLHRTRTDVPVEPTPTEEAPSEPV